MSQLYGTTKLLGLIVRRDRIRLALWGAAIVLLVLVTAVSTKGLFPTQASLDQVAAVSRDNPAALAFNGPPVALDTMGGQVAFQLGAFGLTMVGLMSVLMTSRLTRGEEESGRLELVRSMPVGRHAPLIAAVVIVVALNVVVGVLTAVSLIAEQLPVTGSIALAASFIALGLLFVGLTALTAQVTENRASRRDSPVRSSGPRTRSGPWATPAAAPCRGCRRSASRRSRGPTEASSGGRCC